MSTRRPVHRIPALKKDDPRTREISRLGGAVTKEKLKGQPGPQRRAA